MGLGSGIRDPGKTYSGSRIRGSKRHRIPDPDPQHWVPPSSSTVAVLHYSGSVTFGPDPDPALDPALFFRAVQDANKISFFVITYTYLP
jgi:hypothetical protein